MWSGSKTAGLSGTEATFLRIAEGHAQDKLRRFAIVALPGEIVTWAELATADAGLLQLAEPRATMAQEKLQLLEAKIPALLTHHSSVGSINSLLGGLTDGNGAALLRASVATVATGLSSSNVVGTRMAASAASSGAASSASPSAASQASSTRRSKAPRPSLLARELPYDLMDVSQNKLRKLPRAELEAVCAARGITFDTAEGSEMLVQRLLSFRDREGVKRCARKAGTEAEAVDVTTFEEAAAAAPAVAAAVTAERARVAQEAKAREAAEARLQEAQAQQAKLQAELDEVKRKRKGGGRGGARAVEKEQAWTPQSQLQPQPQPQQQQQQQQQPGPPPPQPQPQPQPWPETPQPHPPAALRTQQQRKHTLRRTEGERCGCRA